MVLNRRPIGWVVPVHPSSRASSRRFLRRRDVDALIYRGGTLALRITLLDARGRSAALGGRSVRERRSMARQPRRPNEVAASYRKHTQPRHLCSSRRTPRESCLSSGQPGRSLGIRQCDAWIGRRARWLTTFTYVIGLALPRLNRWPTNGPRP